MKAICLVPLNIEIRAWEKTYMVLCHLIAPTKAGWSHCGEGSLLKLMKMLPFLNKEDERSPWIRSCYFKFQQRFRFSFDVGRSDFPRSFPLHFPNLPSRYLLGCLIHTHSLRNIYICLKFKFRKRIDTPWIYKTQEWFVDFQKWKLYPHFSSLNNRSVERLSPADVSPTYSPSAKHDFAETSHGSLNVDAL